MKSWLRAGKISSLIFGLIVFPIIIAFLNFQLIYPQFRGEFTQYLGSIEVSYISMAKFISQSWPHSSWQPLWYFGYPVTVIYTPLLPFLEVLGKVFFGWSFSHAYRVLTGSAYILAPVSLYFFVWYLTKRQIGGLVTAFSYSFLPSIFAFLEDSVRGDYLAQELEPRRFAVLVRWGEGPHTFSLIFVPLAGLFFLAALRRKGLGFSVLAAIFISLAALTNAVGLWAVVLLCFSLVLGQLLLERDVGAVFLTGAKTALLTLGFLLFWYNPFFVRTFFAESGGSVSFFLKYGIWGILAGSIIVTLLFFLLKKYLGKLERNLIGLFASVFFLIFTFLIVWVYYSTGVELVPQALRLNIEVDMAVAILLGVAVAGLLGLLFRVKNPKAVYLTYPLYLGLWVAVLVPFWGKFQELSQTMPEYSKSLEEVGRSLEQTPEYKVAKWAEENTPTRTRIFMPGNYGFFLNYFTSVSQLRGALYQSSINHWPDDIYYQVTNGKDADISLAWLKIANVSNLIYTTSASGEMYKDYKVPQEKFDSVLEKLEEKNGDIYYKVPLRNPSPAKVVDLGKIKELKAPYNAIDKKPIFDYLNWIEEKSDKVLKFEKVNNDQYKISGNVGMGEGVLVQMAYNSGWHASCQIADASCQVSVKKDPMGFILLEPKEGGNLEITLNYSVKTISVIFGWLVTFLTFLALVFWSFVRKFRKNEKA